MTAPPAPVKPRLSLLQRWQNFVRRVVWRMNIADDVWIASTALIDRTWPKGVHIGPGCWIDEQAVVLTHDMTRGLYLDTRIGANSVIGARAIILPGVSIGAGCIVAPGSLVNRDVGDGASVAGNPARPV